MTKKTVTIGAKRLIIVDEDHGGYKAGYCLMCGRRGWIGKIIHTKKCSVAKALGEETEDG